MSAAGTLVPARGAVMGFVSGGAGGALLRRPARGTRPAYVSTTRVGRRAGRHCVRAAAPPSGGAPARAHASRSLRARTALSMSAGPRESQRVEGRALSRTGWLAWWIQVPLTVVSTGIVCFALFAKRSPTLGVGTTAGLGFNVAAVVLCFVSVLFSWGYTVMGRRMINGDSSPLQRIIRFGLYVSIIGAIIALLGVQSVVGTTLGKALQQGLSSTTLNDRSTVAPIDVLIIQGCVNALMAQLAALITAINLFLRYRNRM